MPLSNKIPIATILTIGIVAFLYSCSSNIKYPQYSRIPSKQHIIHTHKQPKTTYYNKKTFKGIRYLKLHKCKKAINYFRSLGSGFVPEYCLLVSYGYCCKFKKAKAMFEKIENRNINNMWQSRIYTTFGLLLMINKQKIYRDYLTVAYAYNANNKLARILLTKKYVSRNNREAYFDKLFTWCLNND